MSISDLGNYQANFPGDQYDSGSRITCVDMFGRELFEIGDFVLGDVTWKYQEAGDASFTVHALNPSTRHLPLKKLDFEIRIDVPEENQPFWGEPVSCSASGNGALTFQCEELMGRLTDRFISRESKEYASIETYDIIKELIEYAQDESFKPFRDMNIIPRGNQYGGGGPLDKLRSRQYFREEHTNILDAILEFADLEPPINFNMAYEPVGDGTWNRFLDITAVVNQIYPLSTPLVFTISDETNNILDFSFAEDATGLITDAYCGGGSSGDIRFEGHYADDVYAEVYGVREGIINEGDTTDPDWLEDKAHKEVDARKAPLQTISIVVAATATAVGRYAWVGTIWPVRIDYGRIQVDGNFRITSRTYHANNTVGLELQQILTPLI